MQIIVGLGNPGDSYKNTRHNLGFSVLDKMVTAEWSKEGKFKSEIYKLSSNLMFVKPQTHMNSSGAAVLLIANYFKVKPENIIVVHDDLDLKLGKIKVRLGGSAAGHHGVESVISALGTDKFLRVRLGMGNVQSLLGEHKRTSFNAEKFVIDDFLPNEKSTVKRMIKQAVLAIELLIDEGLEAAQRQYN